MRKVFLCTSIFMIISIGYGQSNDITPFKWDEDLMIFQEVIELPKKTKNELFLSVKNFINDSYQNYDAVVNLEDSDLGLISGKSNRSVGNFTFWSNFNYEVKEGKIRVTYSNIKVNDMIGIEHWNNKQFFKSDGTRKKMYADAWDGLVLSYKNDIEKIRSTSLKQGEDW